MFYYPLTMYDLMDIATEFLYSVYVSDGYTHTIAFIEKCKENGVNIQEFCKWIDN